jgi:hypothetical protein
LRLFGGCARRRPIRRHRVSCRRAGVIIGNGPRLP